LNELLSGDKMGALHMQALMGKTREYELIEASESLGLIGKSKAIGNGQKKSLRKVKTVGYNDY
jgi:hypothetical protein